jgi:hypothetical protein
MRPYDRIPLIWQTGAEFADWVRRKSASIATRRLLIVALSPKR